MNAPDLHVHSTFSTYDGMGSPKAVVARAVELGWGAVALTEHGWLGSAPALYQEAKKAGIKPIIGCELYVTPEETLIDGDKTVLAERRHLTVLALSFEGYQNLVTWVSASMQRPWYYNGPRISLDRMAEIAPHGLHHNVVLSGCIGGELCQCILHGNGSMSYAAQAYVESAKTLFPNFYMEIQNHGHTKFNGAGLATYDLMVSEQEQVRDKLLDLARELDVPVIVTNDSHYQSQAQRTAHLAMMARKQNKADRQTSSNFSHNYTYWTHYMRPMEKIADTLPAWAAKQSIQSIHDIVEEADVVLDPLDKFSYALPKSPYSDPVAEVRRRCKARLKSVVARHGEDAQRRFDYELDAMSDFADYLLIYSDIVRMARSQGIYTWTRGSAANSLVCFCLKIHEIDPIHYRLLFERFVNPARAKFPDVDIDIESHRQPDVAKMVTEYMAEIEGEGNVMPICTYSTVSNRNAFRMMAEAAGMSKERVNEVAKLLPQMIDSGMVDSDEEAYEALADEFPELHDLASSIFDAIGGVSQHACAFALGTRDRPLSTWVPNYRIGSSDTEVTQYNMKSIEEMGFLKLDLLKLNTLSIMHSVARQLGKDIDWLDKIMQTEPGIYALDDEKTYEMLRAGRTEGVHSFQGATQRRGGIEVGVASDFDMVAVQALYRPSGTRTGFDKLYVNRRHEREEWESVNELAGEFLDETFGVVLYQEQIMEMGFRMGMSGEEVDDLYKAIKTAKGVGRGAKELFEKFEPTFRKYSDKLMPKDEADALWIQWEACQGYTFNRGHASSYAILALKTAWLRAHYPQEFFIAILERYPDNPRYVAAAIAEGFRFEPPDINTSSGGFSRGSDDKSIRVGLLRIAGVGPGAVAEIVRNQPFASIEDIKERTNGQRVKTPTIEALATVGALEGLGISGDYDDDAQFKLLNFVLGRPRAFKNCKPSLAKRTGGAWKFRGLQRGVEMETGEGKSFCAKLFWIPNNPPFTTKTSATGKYNANLLTVVDENGIPFDLIVSEDKEAESKLITYLARKSHGAVICVEGQVGMPFLRGGNTTFKMWGIAGAEEGKPQMWHCSEMAAKVAVQMARDKRSQRRAA